jgi:hypothetical protein
MGTHACPLVGRRKSCWASLAAVCNEKNEKNYQSYLEISQKTNSKASYKHKTPQFKNASHEHQNPKGLSLEHLAATDLSVPRCNL